MLTFDHIAVSAATLAEGVDWVESSLGVRLAGGGKHPHMSTHNRLLGLGDLYLEVIAVDPEAAAPDQPRWFDLDRFSGPPRLTNWVARSDDLDADLALAPPGTGTSLALARGDYRWKMAVPPDGILPFDGAFPALIQWLTPLHPTMALPESGLRLKELTLAHPQAEALRAALRKTDPRQTDPPLNGPPLNDPRLRIIQGRVKRMEATFETPNGDRSLS